MKTRIGILLAGLMTIAACSDTSAPKGPTHNDSGYVIAYGKTGDSVVKAQCSGQCESAVASSAVDTMSMIFMGNSKRPGAGYVTWQGVSWRIEGLSCSSACDGSQIVPVGTYFFLDDGKGHDLVHSPVLTDAQRVNLYTWINTWHAPDSQ